MKKRFVGISLGLVLVLVLIFCTGVQAAGPGPNPVRALVAFNPEVNQPAKDVLLDKFGASFEKELPIINGLVVLIPQPALNALANETGVKVVELDKRVSAFPKPPWAGGPGGHDEEETPPQETPTGIDRIDANLNDNTGAGVKVAVIDTGIDYTHPDLSTNYKGGFDFVNNDNDPMDDNGHGTHVAGIIAAEDNDIGVVGVAPEAHLYAVKVLDKRGSGWVSDIIAGIGWCTDPNGDEDTSDRMDVANLSLGAPGQSSALHAAVINATDCGVTLVVAAGNESDNAGAYIPAAYDEVITVSAIADFDGQPGGLANSQQYGKGRFKTVQDDDAFAYFSNFGSDIDLAAPGVDIYSTWINGGYKTLSGTSMAAPHVAGAAALYIKMHPSSLPAQVLEGLLIAGWHSGDDKYFTGDPDTIPEPLLNAAGL
jgi:subtilisin